MRGGGGERGGGGGGGGGSEGGEGERLVNLMSYLHSKQEPCH